MPHQSILAHLAPLLTNQLENVATDALAHLLMEYPVISDAFRESILLAGIALPEDLKLRTQATWQDAAIPDLVGLDSEDRYVLIVESKFWAYLTPNQPATYIKRLPSDIPAILLFIAPASRLPTLWSELLDRCNIHQAGDQLQVTDEIQFLTMRLNSLHILGLTSWESLLARLHQKAQQGKDTYAAGDIWQLQSLCARIDEEAFHPLSENEITSPSEKRIFQFRGLLDELVTRLIDTEIVTTTGYHASNGPNYYRRYMSIHGLPNSDWCVEFNTWYNQKYSQTNLWFSATVTPQSSSLFSGSNVHYYHFSKQFLIPLKIPLGVERDEALNRLCIQIVEIINRLASQGNES